MLSSQKDKYCRSPLMCYLGETFIEPQSRMNGGCQELKGEGNGEVV